VVEWKSGINMRITNIFVPFGGEARMHSKVGDI
jgi:hemolysin-activating ACP:hemolysin acyltransferase